MKTTLWIAVLACVLGLVTVHAQAPTITYQSLTIDNTSGGVALSTTLLNVSGAVPIAGCSGRLETAEVRYRYDGTAPTSSEGQLLEAQEVLTIGRIDIAKAIRFIRTTSTSATLKIHCWSLS